MTKKILPLVVVHVVLVPSIPDVNLHLSVYVDAYPGSHLKKTNEGVYFSCSSLVLILHVLFFNLLPGNISKVEMKSITLVPFFLDFFSSCI